MWGPIYSKMLMMYPNHGYDLGAGDGRGNCPAGSQGEFATFGFLSFATTMLSTIINMG